MIVKVARRGGSFQKAAAYYLHDKGADSQERVEWAQTHNMVTNDPEKAWKLMAWTALHNEELKKASGQRLTGQKLKNPVFSYSLSWHPDQKPSRQEMETQAIRTLDYLGLSEHEALVVSHQDEPHPHVHVIANTVHPETGLVASLKFDKRRFQEWALEYERENGTIYCPQREENAQKREQEQKKPKNERQDIRYQDPVIREAWEASDSGMGFKAALEASGYHLAMGRSRVVVVDHWGKAHNPVRYLEGVRTSGFKKRISDLDLSALPSSQEVQEKVQSERKNEYQAQQAFGKWSREARESALKRQEQERKKLMQKHEKERERREKELKKQYKPELKEKELQDMEKKLEKRQGLLERVLWSRKVQKQEYELMKIEYVAQKEEMESSRKDLKSKQDQELKKQQERHESENKRLESVISERKEKFEIKPRESSRELGTGHEKESGGRQRSRTRSPGSPPLP